VDGALATIRDWASGHRIGVGQVSIAGQSRRVAEPVDAAACDLLLALGGDGTTLATLHAAAPVSRPVLGVACGSIGVLTSVTATRLEWALEQVAAGSWTPKPLPGLEIVAGSGERWTAINDFTVIRDGVGQVIMAITVDDDLYARTAGDGLVIATPLGSTAYTMAAGGPALAAGAYGMVITPLAPHAGVIPPLVVGPESRVALSVEPGYGGARFELDGQDAKARTGDVTVTLEPGYATLVTVADQETLFTGLRRRGLVLDSPRILARDARASHEPPR
jgi:NAD+ kinase